MTITFNTNNWTQEQINMLQANVVALLYGRDVAYESVHCENGVCEISADMELPTITEQEVLDTHAFYAQKRAEAAALEDNATEV